MARGHGSAERDTGARVRAVAAGAAAGGVRRKTVVAGDGVHKQRVGVDIADAGIIRAKIAVIVGHRGTVQERDVGNVIPKNVVPAIGDVAAAGGSAGIGFVEIFEAEIVLYHGAVVNNGGATVFDGDAGIAAIHQA